jgi:hypothetical protein
MASSSRPHGLGLKHGVCRNATAARSRSAHPRVVPAAVIGTTGSVLQVGSQYSRARSFVIATPRIILDTANVPKGNVHGVAGRAVSIWSQVEIYRNVSPDPLHWICDASATAP